MSSPQVTLAPDAGARHPLHRARARRTPSPGQYLAAVSASVPLSADDTEGDAAAGGQGRFLDGRALPARDRGRDRRPRPAWAEPAGRRRRAQGDARTASSSASTSPTTGNAFAHGTGVIRVADTNTDFSFKIDTFVSRTSIVYPMAWTKTVVPGIPPRRGRPHLRGRPPDELDRNRGHRGRRPEPSSRTRYGT